MSARLTPEQVEAIWKVLRYCEEDGSEDLGAKQDASGRVHVFQREEDRRWIVYPGGNITWMPL